MRKLITLVLLSVGLLSCSQDKDKSIKTQEMNLEKLTDKNYVEYMLKYVKHYDNEPMYWLQIYKKRDTELEIYVNDMPVFKDYDLAEGYNVGQDINFVILKSGMQNIKYKIFSKNQKEIFTKIRVYTIDNRDKIKKSDSIFTHEKTINMAGSGVYEEEFTFTANVPYENKGWSDGQDLRKLDKKELEKAVVKFYETVWKIYKERDKESFYPLIKDRDIETNSSYYENKEGLEEAVAEYNEDFEIKDFELQPLEDYKLVLYGGGKIACLEHTSMDKRIRGKLALWAKFRYDGEKSVRTVTPNLYLYLPQGKNIEDGLQIIR